MLRLGEEERPARALVVELERSDVTSHDMENHVAIAPWTTRTVSLSPVQANVHHGMYSVRAGKESRSQIWSPTKQASTRNLWSSSRPQYAGIGDSPLSPKNNQENEDHVHKDKDDSVPPKPCHDVYKSNPARSASVSILNEVAVPPWCTASKADGPHSTTSPRELLHVEKNGRYDGAVYAKRMKAFDYSLVDPLNPFLNSSNLAPSTGRASESATTVLYTYYPFLTVNNTSQSLEQDFKFLEMEGCFHVPAKIVMNDLVHQYFANVHPHLPLLSETEFWESYRASYSSAASMPKLSLLVFQAMLFAASNVRSEVASTGSLLS